ncbi:MAG: hypothetical protein KDD50_12705 [Bdellovibrionales bacterium]|nr:hypothetical protein [Bdellovibrionales bacterium]
MKTKSILLFTILTMLSCAYKVGYPKRALAGGYDKVAISVFENKTREVGVEVYFTNALVRNFERSKVAKVVSKNIAPVSIVGEIDKIELDQAVIVSGGDTGFEKLPLKSVLTINYNVKLNSTIKMVRNSDHTVLWSGKFYQEKVYSAPQLESAKLNSANALYNQRAKHQVYKAIAQIMMKEVHDRMTENF